MEQSIYQGDVFLANIGFTIMCNLIVIQYINIAAFSTYNTTMDAIQRHKVHDNSCTNSEIKMGLPKGNDVSDSLKKKHLYILETDVVGLH